MAHEFFFHGSFPWPDPGNRAVDQAAELLGTPVEVDPDGSHRVIKDGLLTYWVEAEDAAEASDIRRRLGFETNLILIFVDYSRGHSETFIRNMQNMVQVIASFLAFDELRGVLLEEDDDNAAVLAVERGSLVLNEGWGDWAAWPEALATVPRPYRMDSIRLPL
jgi:hypothetical protein